MNVQIVQLMVPYFVETALISLGLAGDLATAYIPGLCRWALPVIY